MIPLLFDIYNKFVIYWLDIYEIVHSGSWTLDKMGEMSTAVAADINGDGLYTNEDR